MKRLVDGLIRFWSEPIRPEPLALFRILVGIVAIAAFCSSMLPLLERYIDQSTGLTPSQSMGDWLTRTWRFSILCGPDGIPWLGDLLPADLVAAWRQWGDTRAAWVQLSCILIAALVFMTLGLFTRTTTAIAWLIVVSFNNRLSWYINGGDALIGTSLFYLMLSPAGATWSLDARLFGHDPDARISPWSVRLMQIQLALVYFFTGCAKLGPDWWTGEAVYWVLNDLSLNRWPYHWTPVPMMVCRLLSWGTLLFELGFPLLVAWRRTRRVTLYAGIALHLGIWIMMEVGWFSQITLCWYVLFFSADEIRSVAARFRRT